MSDPQPLRALVDDPDGVPNSESVLRVVKKGYFTARTMHTNAFEDQRDEDAQARGLAGRCMSVVIRSVWERESGEVQALLRHFAPGSGLAEIRVLDLRNLQTPGGKHVPQGVMPDPREDAPWHAVVFDLGGGTQRSKGGQRAVVEIAGWFWHPDD